MWDEIEGIHYTENVDDILNDPEIDMVVICTTHHLHYEYAKKVLNAHKHCLVEKPFMETSEQAKEIFALLTNLAYIVQHIKIEDMIVIFLTVQKSD